MKLVRSTLLVAGLGLLALGVLRHNGVRALRQENERLLRTLGEVQQLREENARLCGPTIDAGELNRLRDEKRELMKLRSEIGELRQVARVTVPELQTQIQSALTQTEAEQKKGDLIQARFDARELAKKTRNSLENLASVVHAAGKQNAGRLPDSFERLESIVAAQPETHVLRRAMPSILNSTNSWQVPARNFEFLPHTGPVSIRDKSALILRERTPRAAPDGGWHRAYAFANGRVEEAFSPNGDFNAWERQQTSQP